MRGKIWLRKLLIHFYDFKKMVWKTAKSESKMQLRFYNDNHIKCVQFLIFMPNTLYDAGKASMKCSTKVIKLMYHGWTWPLSALNLNYMNDDICHFLAQGMLNPKWARTKKSVEVQRKKSQKCFFPL